MTDPIVNAQQQIQSSIVPNGKGAITATVLQAVLLAMLAADLGTRGVALTGVAGSNVLPASGNSAICLAPGQSATLPAGVPAQTHVTVSDCTQNVSSPPPVLSQVETINAASDATIAGAPSYALTIAGQSITFRKTAAGPWQPE